MRSPLLPTALLALALAPGTALGAALSAEIPQRDQAAIVLDDGRSPVLDVSAIEQEVGPGDVLFRATPRPRRVPPPPPLVLLESPEEILLRHYRNDPRVRLAGRNHHTRFLDALLLLCSPIVIPLMLRRRTIDVPWPDDEEEDDPASPM